MSPSHSNFYHLTMAKFCLLAPQGCLYYLIMLDDHREIYACIIGILVLLSYHNKDLECFLRKLSVKNPVKEQVV